MKQTSYPHPAKSGEYRVHIIATGVDKWDVDTWGKDSWTKYLEAVVKEWKAIT